MEDRLTRATKALQDYLFVRALIDAAAYLVAKAPDLPRKRQWVNFLEVVTGAEDEYFRETFDRSAAVSRFQALPALDRIARDSGLWGLCERSA